jgi:hypothetical protein
MVLSPLLKETRMQRNLAVLRAGSVRLGDPLQVKLLCLIKACFHCSLFLLFVQRVEKIVRHGNAQ